MNEFVAECIDCGKQPLVFENDGSILATMHLTKAMRTLLQRSK